MPESNLITARRARRFGVLSLFLCLMLPHVAVSGTSRAIETVSSLPRTEREPAVCKQSCSDGYVGGTLCIDEKQDGNQVHLYAVNTFQAEVTVNLEVAAQGLRLTRSRGATVVPPGGKSRVATLERTGSALRPDCQYRYAWTFGAPGVAGDDYAYALPFDPSERHALVQGFNGDFSHQGVYALDWDMPEGTRIRAMRSGIVVAYYDRATVGGLDPALKSPLNANWLLIRHSDGTLGAYWHLKPGGVLVRPGQVVQKGEVVALSGNTGFAAGPHLHFEVRSPVNGHRYQTVPFRVESLRALAHERHP